MNGRPDVAPTGRTAKAGIRLAASAVAIALAVTAAVSAMFAQSGPRVEFTGEEVSLDIVPGRVTVTGTYRFLSTGSPRTVPIFYPFPVDETAAFPDSIAVSFLDGGPITFTPLPRSGSISFPLAVTDETAITVTYSQKLHTPRARYILTDDGPWIWAIDRAEFTVVLPDSLEGVRFNYEFTLLDRKAGKSHYRMEKRRFFPARDLVVEWEQ